MKKIILLAMMPFFLNACTSEEYVHSSEPRSNVYFGQPVADLYENFGTPTRATYLSENERVLIYVQQEVEKDWAYRYVRGCVMKFHLKDERVVDWSAEGQACLISSETSAGSILTQIDSNGINHSKTAAQTGRFGTSYAAGSQNSEYPYLTNTPYAGKRIVEMPNGARLPDDAFEGKASTLYITDKQPYQKIALPNGSVAYTSGTPTSNTPYQTTMMPLESAPRIDLPQGQPAGTSIIRQVPDDAFGGTTSTFYKAPTQSAPAAKSSKSGFFSWFTSSEEEEDDWGLFD